MSTQFITTHAAFGYLAQRYDLTQIAISGLSLMPSPRRRGLPGCSAWRGTTEPRIFSDSLVSPALAKAIAGHLGPVTDVLSIEGLTDQSRGRDYFSIIS